MVKRLLKSPLPPETLDQLQERAGQGGHLTLDDVLELTDDELEDPASLGDILLELAGREIDLNVTPTFGPTWDPAEADLDIRSIPTDDAIGLYFRQMAEEPLLTREEEVYLARRIEIGVAAGELLGSTPDLAPRRRAELEAIAENAEAARQHMARANTRLVVSIAKRYMGSEMQFSDLIQEGNVGLMRAVDKYDYKRGYRFSTYATWWVRQAVTRALAQKTRNIRIPLHMNDRIRRMYRVSHTLEQELGHRPTPEELAQAMDVTSEQVNDMLQSSRRTIALERPVGQESDAEFGDFIADTDTPGPSEVADLRLLQEAIEDALEELTPRQGNILRMRFGLGGSKTHTLEEIANKFGLSRERIRQIEHQALRRLRHPRQSRHLRDYLPMP